MCPWLKAKGFITFERRTEQRKSNHHPSLTRGAREILWSRAPLLSRAAYPNNASLAGVPHPMLPASHITPFVLATNLLNPARSGNLHSPMRGHVYRVRSGHLDDTLTKSEGIVRAL